MSALIEVESIDTYTEPGQTYPSSLMVARGRVIGTPRKVTFVADARVMGPMRAMLAMGERIVAEVEGWQMQEMN